jgi:hypothetical protein
MRLRLILSTSLMLSFFGCSASRDVEIAKSAVQRFHHEVAAGQDDMIYDRADPAWRESMDRETNRRFFERFRRKMGACGWSTMTRDLFKISTSGTFVKLEYRTKCAGGWVSESFSWRIRRGEAFLVGYNAANSLLVTD